MEKILGKIFGKNPHQLFLDFDPAKSSWRVVSWNFDLDLKSKRQWAIELKGGLSQAIHWSVRDFRQLSFFKHQKLIREIKLTKNIQEYQDLMNLSIHACLKYGIESHLEFIKTPISDVTAIDGQTELRGLQWIQATFRTVTEALESLKFNKDLILTAACFSGTVPETQEVVLRVIVFNLDIFYYMRPDYSLQIVVFNDKDLGHGATKNPSFQQTIKVTKPQFYDEIIKLLMKLAKAGEID